MNYTIESYDCLKGKDEKRYDRLIDEVLNRLPKSIARKVVRESRFFAVVRDDFGGFLKDVGKKIIILNWQEFKRKKLSDTQIMNIICHEVCHAILKSYDEQRVTLL